MQKPPDSAARERALDPSHSFIVQAPAGSGKTELLARRYLTLLAHVDAPEKVLAITFTKKAAAEMRGRIAGALRDAAQNTAEQKTELQKLAANALANDARHGWNVRANSARLRIQTIDSFCAELVRRMPWSARFGAPPEIVEDAAPLHRLAAGRALNRIEEDLPECKHLLERVDANWIRARDLLAGMLEKRGQWLPLGRGASREALARMWRQAVEEQLRAIAPRIPRELHARILECAAFADASLSAEGNEKFSALRGAKEFPGAHANCAAAWHALAALFLTGGKFRKRVDKRLGFPAERREEKERMQTLLAQLGEHAGAAEALQRASLLPAAAFTGAQSESVEMLMQLLRHTMGELHLLFRENNQSDFTELTIRASEALGGEENPTDLALVYDRRIEHLLMDEFQDTSESHFALLKGLTREWQRDDGRSVFFVGDPMQSVYRFREAEVGHFLHVRKHGFGNIALEPLELQSNFRSSPQLVEWFNQTFRQVLPSEDNIAEGAVRYSEARAHVRDVDGAVHVHAMHARTAGEESDALAAEIANALRDDAQKSIAVLGRTRTHLREVAAALHARGIAFQAVELEPLGERAAIRDLVALTRALSQPADRIACLSVLRAPWCGMTLADLAALAANQPGAPLPELWRDEKVCAALTHDARARLQVVRDVVDAALARARRMRMRQNVEAAWLALGAPAVVDADELDDCQRYFELLDEMEDERAEFTAQNLRNALEKLWARARGTARVQLLTIHKAKGLEFDTVFLPALGRGAAKSEKELLRWKKLPQQLLIAPLPARAGAKNGDDEFYRYLDELDKQQRQNESKRLLYVACTRAKKHLHVFGGVGANGKPAAGSLLHFLWPQVEQDFARTGAAEEDAPDTADAKPTLQTLHKLPRAWSPPKLPDGIAVKTTAHASDAEEIEFSWAGEIARATGVVMHEILQRAHGAAIDAQPELWRNKLAQQGVPAEKLDAALAQVTAATESMRDDSRAAWIFSREHREICVEWPLSGVLDGGVRHVIIDRSFVDANGDRWIIDFKSSRHEGGDLDAFLDRELERHRRQLETYAALVGALENRRVRAALYFPALRGWRELPEN